MADSIQPEAEPDRAAPPPGGRFLARLRIQLWADEVLVAEQDDPVLWRWALEAIWRADEADRSQARVEGEEP